MVHEVAAMSNEWPFAEKRNVAVITVRQIIRNRQPILRVSHDNEDGCWQFLEWEEPTEKDALVVALETIVALDSSVKELADLPLGWTAFRRGPCDPWCREARGS
jgi:hypothetical protein